MRKGFTLIETLIATSLTTLVVVAAVGSWILFLHKSNKASNQAFLDMDVRRVIEQFRHEVRDAARETIMFYPENQEPYLALGFALASDTDNDGLMDMDADGSNILWRETIVYHVWNSSDPPEMRRTVFYNRNNDATRSEYYKQLATVTKTGSGESACLSGERAQTLTMFSNLFTGKLWHAEATYDGYDATANKREKITFGSMSLKPGKHKMDLTITGKNPASSGRALRIDQLSLGVCGWMLETELCELEGASTASLFTGPNLAGAAYNIYAATTSDGDKLSVTLYNDAIEEAEFIGAGRNISQSNTVVKFDEDYTPLNNPRGSYATLLDGQFAVAWDAAVQTAGRRDVYVYITNCVLRIPVMSSAMKKDGYGPVFRLYKSLYNYGADIRYAYYDYVDKGTRYPLAFYQYGVKKSGWAECSSMDFVELRPENTVRVEEGSTLRLTLDVRINTYKQDLATAFTMRYPYLPGAWMYIRKDSGSSTNSFFSMDEQAISNNFNIVTLNALPLLESIAVGYADRGEYISHPYDTHSFNGVSKAIKWDADVPTGADLQISTRSGDKLSENGFEIADAPGWDSLSPSVNGGTINGSGRYVQFRAYMKGQPNSTFPGISGGIAKGPYVSDTPRLNRVFMRWDGEEKYVDVTGTLMKSPDCGIFKVEVDGNPLIRGVTMEIEIFKDIATMSDKKERLTSAMMAEVEPRNSKND